MTNQTPHHPDLPFEDCVLDPRALAAWRELGWSPMWSSDLVEVVEQPMPELQVFGQTFVPNPGEMMHTLLRRDAAGAILDTGGLRWSAIRSTDPQEVASAWGLVRRAHGNVLCIGAGIGVVQQLLARQDAVRHVVTVESDAAVAQAVAARLAKGQECLAADPVDFLRGTEERFDCVYLHPFNTYSFDHLPILNWVSSEARRALVPSSTSKVYAWGYQRMVELYEEFWLSVRAKMDLGRTPARIRDELLAGIGAASPLAAEAVRWFRMLDFQTKGASADPAQVRAAARICALRSTMV